MTTVKTSGYRDLVAWQKAMSLVTDIYELTRSFPREELYGLAGQLRRAAVSVPSNLAEGYSRNSRTGFHPFVGQARGSLAEVETQIEIACNPGYVTPERSLGVLASVAEVGRLLTGLRTRSQKQSLAPNY